MSEKTLGQVAWEAHLAALPARANRWQAVADAVIAEYEARRWRGIAELGEGTVQGTIGRWSEGKWELMSGFLYLPYWRSKGWTHYLAPPTELPAPPKEGEYGA